MMMWQPSWRFKSSASWCEANAVVIPEVLLN